MPSEMRSCPWKPIAAFDGWAEFERFQVWLSDQIAAGMAKEIPVITPYSEAPLSQEKWFLHVSTRQVWRLVWPEPPFAGFFKSVI